MRRTCTHGLLLSITFFLALQAFANPTALPRIEPAGIDGSVLLVGDEDVPEPILTRFLELAGGKKGRVVIVIAEPEAAAEIPAEAGRLIEIARRLAVEIVPLRIDSRAAADDAERLTSLKTATGAWLSVRRPVRPSALAPVPQVEREIIAGSSLEAELRGLRKRGGIVGTGAAVESLGPMLLPDARIVAAAKSDASPPPDGEAQGAKGVVGYEIQPGSALLVRGRHIEALGQGNVFVHLPPGSVRAAERLSLKNRPYTDLTLLRRAVRDRVAHPFPSPPGKEGQGAREREPVVEKGTLVIVGGGRTPAGLMKQFVDLAGGDKADIVLLPTAVPDPIPNQNLLAESMRKHGARVTILPGRRRQEVESDEYLKAFRNATGIWFGGGRQWRFVDAYENTEAHKLMHAVLERGGVIGGTSAGASIQAEYMARGSPYGNLEIMAEGYERGLGFLKGVAIDQHFTQRRRHADMTSLVKKFPQFLGIGIDEGTAIIVRGHIAEVVGQGRTFFYDAQRTIVSGQPDYDALPADGVYDLKARKIVER